MKVLCMHTAGLGELVALSLGVDVHGQVLYADDSAVLIQTTVPQQKLGRVSYVKNCFAVLGSVPRRRNLGQAVEAIAMRVPQWSLRRTRQPYRLMFSEDGQLAGVPTGSRARLEQAVSRATGGQFTPRGGGDEYWAITRRDLDEVLFCQRIPRPVRPKPPKGGLAPDLAELIVNATTWRPEDVVLDPFAGTGALIAARTSKPFRAAICSDLGYADGSVELQPGLADRAGVRRLADDARSLVSVPAGSIDVVITDPPWGEFDQSDSEPETLMTEALASLRRVVRPGGQLAMLLSRRLAEVTLERWQACGFEQRGSYQLLVNGHPATLALGTRERDR